MRTCFHMESVDDLLDEQLVGLEGMWLFKVCWLDMQMICTSTHWHKMAQVTKDSSTVKLEHAKNSFVYRPSWRVRFA